MNLYKKEKEELIKNGKYSNYKIAKKEVYNAGYEPSDDPKDYDLLPEELDLIKRIEKSTKKKKQSFRRHAYFMSEYYDNIGLLTLSYSDTALNKTSLETKKQLLTEILKTCFEDYIGKFEISPNGRLHFHAIVGWNGFVITKDSYRDGHINQLVMNKTDLTELWYGDPVINKTTPSKRKEMEKGTPTKYGIYDLVLIPKNKKDRDKATNYSLKSLNSMESYIQKDEQIDDSIKVDDELIYAVNTSNILTARNTPYQAFKKAQDEQDREIKRKARVFNSSFYDEHKFDTKAVFRRWAEDNKDTVITDYLDLFEKDFKLVKEKDF